MISISTPLFDLDGAITIEELPSSELLDLSRRMNRVQTLDGGVVVNDTGYSAGDRDMIVRWRPKSHAEFLRARRLVELYPLLNVATREGVFTVAPERVRISGKEAELTLRVTAQRT